MTLLGHLSMSYTKEFHTLSSNADPSFFYGGKKLTGIVTNNTIII